MRAELAFFYFHPSKFHLLSFILISFLYVLFSVLRHFGRWYGPWKNVGNYCSYLNKLHKRTPSCRSRCRNDPTFASKKPLMCSCLLAIIIRRIGFKKLIVTQLVLEYNMDKYSVEVYVIQISKIWMNNLILVSLKVAYVHFRSACLAV